MAVCVRLVAPLTSIDGPGVYITEPYDIILRELSQATNGALMEWFHGFVRSELNSAGSGGRSTPTADVLARV